MNTRALAAFVVAAGSLSAAVSADVVDMRYLGKGAGHNVRVTNGSDSFNVFAGQLRHSFSNGTGLGEMLTGEMITYCIDLSQHVSSTTRNYSVLPVASAPVGGAMGMDKARAVAALYDYALGVQLETSASNDIAASFQLALWEVIIDYNPSIGAASLDITSGQFSATRTNGTALWSGVQNILDGFFSWTDNLSFDTTRYAAITNNSYQDQIVVVPAPGCAALAGMGLGLVATRRRRA